MSSLPLEVRERVLEARRGKPDALREYLLALLGTGRSSEAKAYLAIVLTHEQARRLEHELGVFMRLELDNFWFSKDGRRALMQWPARWTGGHDLPGKIGQGPMAT